MLDLNKDIKFIKGVGPARAKLLNSLGIFTLSDLITYFPRNYEDRGKPKNIAEVEDGEEVLIEAICVSKMMEKRIRKNPIFEQEYSFSFFFRCNRHQPLQLEP